MTTGDMTVTCNGDIRDSIRLQSSKKSNGKDFTDVMDMRLREDDSQVQQNGVSKGYITVDNSNVVKKQLKKEKMDSSGQDTDNHEVTQNEKEDDEEFLEKFSKKLGIDEVVLAEVLSQLGITDFGDINDITVKELAAALTGENSVNALLTNEDTMKMYSAISEFMTEIDAVATNDENAELFAQIMPKAEDVETLQDESGNISVQNGERQITADNETDISVQLPVKDSNVDERTNDIADYKEEQSKEVIDIDDSKETDMNQTINFSVKEKDDEDTSSMADSRQSSQNQSNNQMTEKFIENLGEALAMNPNADNAISEVAPADSSLETNIMNDIVRQIVESVKINISEESTSMEMILNPEHLGRLNLSVTSKSGVMTAQFIVENETARAAIESQVQILKDNLEQQGVKVEAVEVTINNAGSFLGNNAGDDSSNQSATSGSKTKKININLMDEESEEEFDEDEKIIAQVMKQEGSNVNFSA